jgi:hypothetical protein
MDFTSLKRKFQDRLDETTFLVSKTNKSSVLIIQQFPRDQDTEILLPRVRESISNIIAFVELGNAETLEYVLESSDGVFDAIAMDADIKCAESASLVSLAKSRVNKSKLFFYSDNATWADSAIHFIQNIEKGLLGKKILIAGQGLLCIKLIQNLRDFDAKIFWYNQDLHPGEIEPALPVPYRERVQIVNDEIDFSVIDIIVGAAVKEESISPKIIKQCKAEINVFDIGIGNFSVAVIAVLESRKCKIFRLDNRAGISSTMLGLFETDYLINKMMGTVTIKGVELVSGGVMGHKGAVIVDSIKDPSYIVGIADGKGMVNLVPENDAEQYGLDFVQKLITRP